MSQSNVIDFSKKREENIESKKRVFERIMFDDFLGCYSELDAYGVNHPIKMADISRDGCMFQIPFSKGAKKRFSIDDEITLRLYFTKESFLPLVVNIKHVKESHEKGKHILSFGCQFNKDFPSFKAVEGFINFLYQYAEFSCKDRGESKVYFL